MPNRILSFDLIAMELLRLFVADLLPRLPRSPLLNVNTQRRRSVGEVATVIDPNTGPQDVLLDAAFVTVNLESATLQWSLDHYSKDVLNPIAQRLADIVVAKAAPGGSLLTWPGSVASQFRQVLSDPSSGVFLSVLGDLVLSNWTYALRAELLFGFTLARGDLEAIAVLALLKKARKEYSDSLARVRAG